MSVYIIMHEIISISIDRKVDGNKIISCVLIHLKWRVCSSVLKLVMEKCIINSIR